MPRITMLALLALATFGCFQFTVRPQAATPQRPTLAEDTSTTAPGTFELETGGQIDPHDSWDLPLTLKWGMAENAELFLSWSPYQVEKRPGPDASGIGDTTVGLRYRFLNETESVPAAAMELATKVPTGDQNDGLSTGENDFLVAAILGKQVGPVSTLLYYQLGVLGEPSEGDTDIQHAIALDGSVPVAVDWTLFGEVAAVEVPERDLNQIFTTLGLTYTVSEDLVLDVGIVVGLSNDADVFQIVFGYTRNFGGPGIVK